MGNTIDVTPSPHVRARRDTNIGGGAGWVPAREAGFDVPTHVPPVATPSDEAALWIR